MKNSISILGDNHNSKRPVIYTGDNSDLIMVAKSVKDVMPKSGKGNKGNPGEEINAPNLDNFVYVPSLDLYVGKNRELNGKNWNESIKIIYQNKMPINVNGTKINAEMPTPYEFMTFVNYLLSGTIKDLSDTERQNILNDILKTGNYRGNHLNAKFVEDTNGFNNLGIETATFDASGKLVKTKTSLEQYLGQDGWADINSINKQGLLTKSYGSNYEQGKNAYFWTPIKGRVARFDASSDGASLGCDWDPGGSNSSLGVRLVVRPKANAKKIRQKN
jgi:hypothetical protein